MTDLKHVSFENQDLNDLLEELHKACEKGTTEDIKTFFKRHPNLDDLYFDGYSPLHSAVVSGRDDLADVIDLLVEKGIDVNCQTESSRDTPLHLAIENCNFPQNYDVIVRLVHHKADPDIRNRALRSAYDCALARGHDLIAATLDGSKSETEVKNTYRERYGEKYAPHLNRAVLESDEDAIQGFIKKGADANYINKHGAGAIHYAVTRCTLPVMHVLEMLIEAGADVDLRDDEGDSALNLAIKNDEIRKAKQMIPVVKLLVEEAGADISFRDLDGKDAMQLATERNYNDVVAILKKHRNIQLRDPDPDDDVETQEPSPEPKSEQEEPTQEPQPEQDGPETETEKSDEEEEEEEGEDRIVMDSLEDTRDTGGDVNKPNNDAGNNVDDVNDDADDCDEDGLYPIHQAVLKDTEDERTDLLKTLVDAGADVNASVRGLGTTALHLAADRGHVDSVKFLLEHGADKNKKTLVGKTAFDMASDKNHREVMELLGSQGDINRDRWQKGKKKSSTCIIL